MYVGLGQLTTLNDQHAIVRIRRRSAEQAYQKNERYNENKHKHEKIAKLLVETLLNEELTKDEKPPVNLGAGQLKQVHLPVGKTLEETIQLWDGVRNEALYQSERTPLDYQLATKASMNIKRAEAQLRLNQQADTEVDEAVYEERVAALMRLTEGFSTPLDKNVLELNERYKRAVTAYSLQVQQKLSGFIVDTPSFLKIA